jgi:N-acetylglucosaminylphosphatidylinositol deacetylase
MMPLFNFLRDFQRLKSAERVLLVIAHPDDESMFFAPTLHVLLNHGAAVRILCLSNGELRCHCGRWLSMAACTAY